MKVYNIFKYLFVSMLVTFIIIFVLAATYMGIKGDAPTNACTLENSVNCQQIDWVTNIDSLMVAIVVVFFLGFIFGTIALSIKLYKHFSKLDPLDDQLIVK